VVGRCLLAAAVSIVILAESFSSPLPHYPLPTGDAAPAVYKWLAGQSKDAPVAELPQFQQFFLPARSSPYDPFGCSYMYYTIYHNFQPIINGRSGFAPPTQKVIWDTINAFPSQESLNMLKYLGVRFVVVHASEYQGDQGNAAVQRANALVSELKSEGVFGADTIYRLLNPAPGNVRGNLERLSISEAYLPQRAIPKSELEFKLHLVNSGEWPAMSFNLVEVRVIVTESGPLGAKTFEEKKRISVALLPGESQWLALPLKSPSGAGNYHWDVRLSFQNQSNLDREYSFDMAVGKAP